jgi:uncharacterized protein (DUF1501 family)
VRQLVAYYLPEVEGGDMRISRRKFIASGAGMILGSSQLLSLAASAGEESKLTASNRILVIVQLAGGNDGLNTVIPYGCGQYYDGRPFLAVKDSAVLPLSNTIGLHPNMPELREHYQAGKLAVVLGVGYPSPSRSHFRAIEIWQTAQLENVSKMSWLGRYLAAAKNGNDCESRNLFPAINVDPMQPRSLATDRLIVPCISELNQFRFNTDIHYQLGRQRRIETFNRVYGSFDLDRPSAQLLADVGMNDRQIAQYFSKVEKYYKRGVSYPDNGFGRGMKFIAQLITAGAGAQIYNISLGGFDTHADQLATHASLLQQLSRSLSSFQRDLEIQNHDQQVLLLVFSEFGRRLYENEHSGTDHGTAAPVLIMGSAIKGGIYGDYPSLTQLDEGDLRYTTDFRSVYATILDSWLSADSKEILGKKFDNLAFV